MAPIKGYVVRGKHSEGGGDVWLVYEPTGEHLIASRKAQRTEFQSLGSAIQAWADAQVLCDEAAIYQVHPDGREERLPSYEEALALLDGATSSDAYLANVSTQLLATMRENDRLRAIESADPLAALEAAERRLLEAGGWTAVPDADYRRYWRDRDGRMCKQAVAILQEKRRLAAKGGA